MEKDETILFTIGYEGKSIEEYIELLRQNRVHALVDVRYNPLSRKKGFSKTALKAALEGNGIRYYHIRSLGIPSSLRKNISTETDYERLFADYYSSMLPSRTDDLLTVSSLLDEHRRIALTCFEKDPDHCHRGRVVRYMISNGITSARVTHL